MQTSCVLTELGVETRNPAAPADERYLLYQPQFELSMQALALRTALAWASLLNRTLVLPHLLGHKTATHAAFGSAYDLNHARAAVAPVRLAEMDQFVTLGVLPERCVISTTKKPSMTRLTPCTLAHTSAGCWSSRQRYPIPTTPTWRTCSSGRPCQHSPCH